MASPSTNIDLSRASWHKSSHSNGGEAACVEVADDLPGIVAVRDSKDPDGPKLIFTHSAWHAFTRSITD